MRSIRSVRFARWILEHMTFGWDNEALSGDLLEEFHSGRSASWYWRQVSAAVAAGACRATRTVSVLVVFSAAWTMLYPAWISFGRNALLNATPGQWTGLAWPYSPLAEIGYGVVPGVVFVWLGLIAYRLLRAKGTGEALGHGMVRGMSQGLTAMLLWTLVLVDHLKHPQVDLTCVTRGDFYSIFSLGTISIPVAISLLAALLTPARASRISRTRRTSGEFINNRVRRVFQAMCLTLSFSLSAGAQTSTSGPSVQFVTVDQGVRLEVLDWGGIGRPMVFLAGLGNDAHVFDTFAPKFTAKYHVYGITRRGFGASSKPVPTRDNYGANRLGDDVLVVMDTLKLDRPVLVGHSLAGEELSSIGSRHPERVAGLIYLEAGYGYAFYDRVHGDAIFDFFRLQKRLEDFMAGAVGDSDQFMKDFSTNVSQLDKDLKEADRLDPTLPVMRAPRGPIPPIIKAINLGAEEYSKIPVPVLAIFACPHNFDDDPSLKNDPKTKAALVASSLFYVSRQADAFAAGIPSARVVRLPNADHYVFRSNEAEVMQEMNAFLTKLP